MRQESFESYKIFYWSTKSGSVWVSRLTSTFNLHRKAEHWRPFKSNHIWEILHQVSSDDGDETFIQKADGRHRVTDLRDQHSAFKLV